MVYIKSLDKNIFPKYTLPYPDELFSSWLCRVAENHKLKSKSFITNYIKRDYPVWNRDIDVLAPVELIELFNNHTPVSKSNVIATFLKSYEGYAFNQIKTNGVTQNIIPLGINSRSRSRFGQQCCCSCLAETSYYKKQWRLSTSVLCKKCKEFLIDRCPSCKSPISFFRVNFGGNGIKPERFSPLHYCYQCNFDLSLYRNNNKPNDLHLNYQKEIDELIEKGFNKMTNYSFTYIRILLALSLRLRANTKKNYFKVSVENYLDKEFEYFELNQIFWSVEQRYRTFPTIHNLLMNHFEEIELLFKEAGVLRSTIFKDAHEVPFWFEKIFYH